MNRREFLSILSAGAVATCLPSIPLLSVPDLPELDDIRRDGENIYVYARTSGPISSGDIVVWDTPTTVRRAQPADTDFSRMSVAGDAQGRGHWIQIYGSATVAVAER